MRHQGWNRHVVHDGFELGLETEGIVDALGFWKEGSCPQIHLWFLRLGDSELPAAADWEGTVRDQHQPKKVRWVRAQTRQQHGEEEFCSSVLLAIFAGECQARGLRMEEKTWMMQAWSHWGRLVRGAMGRPKAPPVSAEIWT